MGVHAPSKYVQIPNSILVGTKIAGLFSWCQMRENKRGGQPLTEHLQKIPQSGICRHKYSRSLPGAISYKMLYSQVRLENCKFSSVQCKELQDLWVGRWLDKKCANYGVAHLFKSPCWHPAGVQQRGSHPDWLQGQGGAQHSLV